MIRELQAIRRRILAIQALPHYVINAIEAKQDFMYLLGEIDRLTANEEALTKDLSSGSLPKLKEEPHLLPHWIPKRRDT